MVMRGEDLVDRVEALEAAIEADDSGFTAWEIDWIAAQAERAARCRKRRWMFELSDRQHDVLEELEERIDG